MERYIVFYRVEGPLPPLDPWALRWAQKSSAEYRVDLSYSRTTVLYYCSIVQYRQLA